MSFIYLASPFASDNTRIRKVRFQKTVDATVRLIEKGHVVFSPIVHNFTLTLKSSLEMGFEQWRAFDLQMIDAALAVWVLNIDGWAESGGVTYELNHAHWSLKPTFFVDYETLEVTKLDVPEVLNGRLWAAQNIERALGKNLDDHDNAIDK